MSNQPPAHVADERAAFEAWSSGPEKRCTDQQLKKNANGEYIDGYTNLDWMAWQAARADLLASLAAGAPAETPKPDEQAAMRVLRYIDQLGSRLAAAGFDHAQQLTITRLLMDREAAFAAAQPAPAPATDAALVDFNFLIDGRPYVNSTDKANGSMTVNIHYSSRGYGNAAFERIKDAIASAMLSANSPREAG